MRFDIGPQDDHPMLDLSRADFAQGPKYYDFDHGTQTAKMALVLLSYEHPQLNVAANRQVLWTGALFHDIGRQAPWNIEDPYHGARGADILDAFLRGEPTFHAAVKLREAACRLVARHSEPPDDPLSRCLADADTLEAVRLEAGTRQGATAIAERITQERLHTSTAKRHMREMVRTHMYNRGWQR